jgi:hypothetical protein
MERHHPPDSPAANPEQTLSLLTSEVSEVESAIQLVASGQATRVTVTGLRFGEALAARFDAEARTRGIQIEPLPWADDAGCDLLVRHVDE